MDGIASERVRQLLGNVQLQFGFCAGVSPEARLPIMEPVPSVTSELGAIAAGPRRGAAYDAINAEVRRMLVWHFAARN